MRLEDEILKSFKRCYPEKFIRVRALNVQTENAGIICAEFPDGLFYFVVTPISVSSAYNTLEDAIELI